MKTYERYTSAPEIKVRTKKRGKSKKHFKVYCVAGILSLGWISPLMSQSRLYPNAFDLSDVTLLEGPFKQAMDLNVKTLLAYDTGRLLQPFHKQAGLSTPAAAFTNWSGLDGHVGGHYLSALAIHVAATRDSTSRRLLQEKLDTMLKELKRCQEALALTDTLMRGYIGGIPNSKVMWTAFYSGNFASFNSGWVPWYNLHKTYNGLRDAWLYTGDSTARSLFLNFCDWGARITSKLSDTQMQSMLETEHGGMNEVFADAYQMTGKEDYLSVAKRFTHKSLLNAMVTGNANWLDNKHANTQVPKAIGFERIYELDSTAASYGKAASFFWNNVVGSRTLALGGNSRNEYFIASSASSDYVTNREGPETCNTHNMLKLTEDLFRNDPKAKYVDFYEQAMYNHILSSQHPEHGGYVYFTPARPRHYRVYSAVNQAMWCCVGTGMENHGKYGQFIYCHHKDSLFVNLFVPSQLDWKAKGITLNQQTRFPFEERCKIVVRTNGPTSFCLLVRQPSWVDAAGYSVSVNNEKRLYPVLPNGYCCVERIWNDGDSIVVALPMNTTWKQLPNMPDYVALMHGPLLLSAETGDKDLTGLVAGEGRWEHLASGALYALNEAPMLIGERSSLSDSIRVLNADSLWFEAPGLLRNNYDSSWHHLVLKPFFKLHDCRYMMYWMQLTPAEYKAVYDALAMEEAAELALDERTVDQIRCGEQQPDQDHNVQGSSSYTGTYQNTYYRDARSGGWFSYDLKTGGHEYLSLNVTYWGNDIGSRTFDIVVGNDTICTENTSGKWGLSSFQTVNYKIPSVCVRGRDQIRVKFDARAGHYAGGVFNIRVMSDTLRTWKDDMRTVLLADVDAGYALSEGKVSLYQFNSYSATTNNQTNRTAPSGGFFRYTLPTGGLEELFLRVRYWGNESGLKTFDVMLDTDTLATVNLAGKWGVDGFREVDYSIPAELAQGKSKLNITFKPRFTHTAGGIYYVWLMGRQTVLPNALSVPQAAPLPECYANGGELRIRVPGETKGDRIRVFSTNGMLLYSGELMQEELTLPASSLSKTLIVLYSGHLGIQTTRVVMP